MYGNSFSFICAVNTVTVNKCIKQMTQTKVSHWCCVHWALGQSSSLDYGPALLWSTLPTNINGKIYISVKHLASCLWGCCSHLTAPPAITQWNTLAPGLKPTGILPIIISYIHTTAGVSASLGSLLSSLLSSVLYPPFSVCLSLSLLRLVYLRGKAFWFVWAMTGGRSAASRALRSVGKRGKQSQLVFLSFPRNQPEWLDESVSAFTEIYLWG